MKSTYFSLLLLASLVVTACGGAQNPPPKPLKYHFDEQHIASVSMDDKQEMLAAQNEYHRAKAERMKVEADLEQVKTDIDVAKNEVAQAKLAKKSAATQKKKADESEDMTRINAAARDERIAEVSLRAAKQKVTALKAKKKWLDKLLRYTQENVFATEARYELAKTQVARANNISPRGYAQPPFVEQQKERSRKAQRAKLIADREKEAWQKEVAKWKEKRKDEHEARGTDTASSKK